MTANRRASRLVIWVALLATGLFGLVACGGDEDRPRPAPTPLARSDGETAAPESRSTESPAPVTQSRSSGESRGISTGGSTAEQLAQKVDLPDTFPSDAPVYPGTQPSQYVVKPNGRLSLTFGTPDSPDQVMSYMRDELPRRRWEIIGEHDLETGKLLQATKGDRLISVLLSRIDEGQAGEVTMIAMSVDP